MWSSLCRRRACDHLRHSELLALASAARTFHAVRVGTCSCCAIAPDPQRANQSSIKSRPNAKSSKNRTRCREDNVSRQACRGRAIPPGARGAGLFPIRPPRRQGSTVRGSSLPSRPGPRRHRAAPPQHASLLPEAGRQLASPADFSRRDRQSRFRRHPHFQFIAQRKWACRSADRQAQTCSPPLAAAHSPVTPRRLSPLARPMRSRFARACD